MDYLMVCMSVFGIAIQFSLQKLYQLRFVKKPISLLFFALLSGLVSSIFFLCINCFRVSFSGFSLGMAALLALCMLTNVILGIKIVSLGKISIFTLFMMFGGMILPYLYGVIFLGENPSVSSIIGIGVLLIAMIIPSIERRSEEKNKNKFLFYVLCCAVFVINGCVSILSKMHQINASSIDTNSFLVYVNAFTCIFSAVATLFIYIFSKKISAQKIKTNPCPNENFELALSKKSKKKQVIIAIAIIVSYSLVSGLSYMLQLVGAKSLPATVLYPIITGGTVALSALAGRIFFKEKITRNILIGLLLAIGGTLLFLF